MLETMIVSSFVFFLMLLIDYIRFSPVFYYSGKTWIAVIQTDLRNYVRTKKQLKTKKTTITYKVYRF